MLLKRAFVVSSVRWKHPVPQENGETFIAFLLCNKGFFFYTFYQKILNCIKNLGNQYFERGGTGDERNLSTDSRRSV